MIRRLYTDRFDVLEKAEDHMNVCAVVDKVGYEVKIPHRSFSKLQGEINAGRPAVVECYHQLTETEEFIFGFADMREFTLFTMFLEVSGVGKKTGLSLVQNMSLKEVKKAVRKKNLQFFQQVSGVGSSTAEKIYISMKSQLGL